MFGVGLTLPKVSAVLLNAIGGLLAAYKINDLTPDLVADFNGSLNTGTEFYDAGGTVDTFAELITHSRAGNATMTDGYGPELWTNPAQTLQGPWVSAGSGVYTIDGSQSSTVGVIDDDFVVIGKSYSITYTVSNRSAGGVTGQVGATSGNTNSSDGTYTDIVVATATNKPRVNANSSFIGTVSKISVREVPAIKWAPHNLLRYSEDLSNADPGWPNWSDLRVTIGTNAVSAPDGSTTADSITPTAVSGTHYVGQPYTDLVSVKQTISAFLKSNGYNYCFVGHGIGPNEGAWFNLSTGSVGTIGTLITSASMNDVGDGWFLCSVTYTTASTPRYSVVSPCSSDNTISFTGDGSSGIYVWGIHRNRSDLGGMVDNPDRGDSYVPTTSSAVYLPRRNHHVYNGDDWVNEGVLHESEARTNLVTYSQDFTDASWNAVASTIDVTAYSGSTPDGQTAGFEISEPSTTSTHALRASHSFTSGQSYTLSVFAKKSTSDWCQLLFGAAAFPTLFQNFNLSTGEKGTGSGFDSSEIQDVGNGWYRISITATASSTASTDIYIALTDNTDSVRLPSYAGDGSSGVYIYGAQLEAAPTPSSYIPTSGATVSRALETLTIPAANMPWPEPNYIGPELVVNGDFSNGTTDWTVRNSSNATIAEVSGQLVTTVVSSGANGVYQEIPTVVGKVYTLSSLLVSKTALNVRIRVGTSIGGTQYDTLSPSSNGQTSTLTFKATSTSLFYELGYDSNPTAGDIFVWDNVTVREIDPLSVSIQMQGRMTYADTGGSDRFIQWGALSGEEIRESLSYGGSQIGTIQSLQRAGGVPNAVNVFDAYQPGVLVPFNFASRNGSTFVNAAADGVSATVITTPTALPDLSATDFELGYDYMGTISMLRVWADDLADVGIAEASEPSEVPSLQLTFDNSETSFTIQDWEQ